jgi:hypothetical protein
VMFHPGWLIYSNHLLSILVKFAYIYRKLATPILRFSQWHKTHKNELKTVYVNRTYFASQIRGETEGKTNKWDFSPKIRSSCALASGLFWIPQDHAEVM